MGAGNSSLFDRTASYGSECSASSSIPGKGHPSNFFSISKCWVTPLTLEFLLRVGCYGR